MLPKNPTPELLHDFQRGALPGLLGLEVVSIASGAVSARINIEAHHLAPNGFLHAASVIMLADTACGYGCVASLPEGASNFTTIELKSNFLGTAREGVVSCVAQAVHLGKNTQVWDATVSNAAGKTIALFRCTQMVLWPK